MLGIPASNPNNSSGNKSIIFDPEDHCYDSNEWYALINSYKDKFLKARSGRNLEKKYNKSGGHSNSGGDSNNGQGEWKSNIVILEKKFRNQKRQM